MGTNCAGYIAKVYCVTCEIVFKRSKADEGNHDMAKQIPRVITDISMTSYILESEVLVVYDTHPRGFVLRIERNMADEGVRVLWTHSYAKTGDNM